MQKIHVFGLDYQSANFNLREKFALSREAVSIALKRIQGSGIAQEVVILFTCNRTEVYCITSDIDFVINAVCDIQNVCPRTIKTSSYIYSEEECVRHLFRVASGLTSMVLGETEIVAQIKESLLIAKEMNTIGAFLSGVFHMALSVSKEVRHVSRIGNIAVSIGSACVELVSRFLSKNSIDAANLNDTIINANKILFIGAGQMMQQVAPYFRDMPFAEKAVVNRTYTNTCALATRIEALPLPFDQLPNIVSKYSIIIASCDSTAPLLNEQILEAVINSKKKLLIIDLSMPLVIDVKLKDDTNITVLTIDDIAKIVDVGVEKRKLAAAHAESVIENKLSAYQNWLKKRNLSPVIRALRDDAECIRNNALQIAVRDLENGEDAKTVLMNLSVRLTNKLLHAPTVNLCVANDAIMQDNLVDLVNHLYDLEPV